MSIYQGVHRMQRVGTTRFVEVSLVELRANWQMGANTAQREGFPGVQERTEADLALFREMEPGDVIICI